LAEIGIVIPAAGQGKRMGAGCNKQFLLLMGQPILAHTIRIFQESSDVSEIVHGTDGWVNISDRNYCEIYDKAGKKIWEFGEYVPDKDGKPTHNVKVGPYFQEHIDLVTAIRNNTPVNEAETTAVSTLTAIMGRISAYTGKMVTWDEMLNSDLKLGPKVFDFGPVDVPKEVPVPGEGDKPAK